MSFEEFCLNGSFLDKNFNGTVNGVLAGPDFYSNQLNKLQRISLGILFFILSSVAIVSNGLALLTIYKKRLQILYKCCIVSQCFSDFLMAIFVGINSLNNFIQDTIEWKFGAFMCGWIPYVTTMSALLSSMMLTCIAIDRYQGIVLLVGLWDPKFLLSILTVGCLWVVAAKCTVPTFLSYNIKPTCFLDFTANTSTFTYLCLSNKTISSQYFIIIFTLIFFPLLVTFAFVYIVIAKIIWFKEKKIKGQQLTTSASTVETNLNSQAAQEAQRDSQNAARVKTTPSQKKIRTFTIILIIMSTFIACRLPQWVFLVVTSFPQYRLTGNFWWVTKYLLSALSLSNTVINPFIYSFLNEMVNLKSNLATGFKNLKSFKLKNIRMNFVSHKK